VANKKTISYQINIFKDGKNHETALIIITDITAINKIEKHK
jgi:hypothetical protein